ncbi:hypothetical protein J3D47_004138 [Pseudomonas laurylsulfativorans]|uniref:hypothetical protein n=1 Tax=Pseudomonas laurylsulfativorans TaxID=1943631 RepID=UPI00209D41FA|nr:hypothetical protein [Pseudomonas laurylsulfativorans]MCP1419895.1 hypothetical protein [Pseudomonas laurylsulfativorans]
MQKAICVSVLAFMMAGCETTQVSPDQAKQVSQSDVYAFGRQKNPDDARIVFTQDAGAMSCLGAGMSVYLDGQLAAKTSHGESVKLYHAAGPAQLSIKNNAMCAGGDLSGLLLELKPGYSYQVRGYRGTWDKPEPLLTTPAPFKYSKN